MSNHLQSGFKRWNNRNKTIMVDSSCWQSQRHQWFGGRPIWRSTYNWRRRLWGILNIILFLNVLDYFWYSVFSFCINKIFYSNKQRYLCRCVVVPTYLHTTWRRKRSSPQARSPIWPPWVLCLWNVPYPPWTYSFWEYMQSSWVAVSGFYRKSL